MKDLFSSAAKQLAKKPEMPIGDYPELFNPPAEFQKKFCGSAMLDAYLFGAAFCNILADEIEGIEGATLGDRMATGWQLLDFGCGWGRVTRLLALKYGQRGLFGLDVNPQALAAASTAMPYASFSLLGNLPLSPLRDGLIDLAISVSVFSHLNAAYQDAWAGDLARLVRPGGLAFITYHGPWLMDSIEEFGSGTRLPPSAWHAALGRQTDRLSSYHNNWACGRFSFLRTGGEAMGGGDAYGDALVPCSWADRLWRSKDFTMIKWIEDKRLYPQCIAVLQRNTAP